MKRFIIEKSDKEFCVMFHGLLVHHSHATIEVSFASELFTQ